MTFSMSRLTTEVKTNMLTQYRNGLYHVGIGIGVLIAIGLAYLVDVTALSLAMVGIMLLIVAGSTFLYVAAMVLFEKDEATLVATITSPLTTHEYITAKIISLSILAATEAMTMFLGALLILYFQGINFVWPNFLILLAAVLLICSIFVLIGIILVVRYNKLTDFIMPMAGIVIILQIPIFYFIEMTDNWLLLLFPVSAPTMLMLGAFSPLANWQYFYSIGYSLLCIVALFIWATLAFKKHILQEGA